MTKLCIACNKPVDHEVCISRDLAGVGRIDFYGHVKCLNNGTMEDKIKYVMPSFCEIASGLRG